MSRCDQALGEPPGEPIESLMVGVNGRLAGLIHFRRSPRLELTGTLGGSLEEQPPSRDPVRPGAGGGRAWPRHWALIFT